MTVAQLDIIDRRRDYRDQTAHPKRRYMTERRYPGTVWQSHNATPWWQDGRKMIPAGKELPIPGR
jgi:hypothetical protein